MAQERITWEELTAKNDRMVAFQERYLVIPTFRAKQLVDETLPVLRKGQEIVYKEGATRGARTNISQIEVIYPFLLKKAGFIKEDLPEWAVRESLSKGAIVGQVLHKADAIFSVSLHGIRGKLLNSYLHSFEEEDIGRIAFALREIHIPRDADEEEIATKLKIAWSRYRSIYVEESALNVPLPNFGMVDPREERRFRKSLEVDETVNLLAEAWAKEAVRPEPMTWEFERRVGEEVINQREVMIAVKFNGPNIQFLACLDSVSRKRPTTNVAEKRKRASGKVKSQHVDFKSGSREVGSALDAEIGKRQAQVMRIITEMFTARYLRNYKSLGHKDSAFAMRAMHDSRAGEDRVDLAGYRNLDKETGEMTFEKVGFKDDEERKDAELWLSWYGSMIHCYRDEIRELIARNPNYKLSGVEFSAGVLANLY